MRRIRIALRLLTVILMVTAMGIRGLAGAVLMPELDRAAPATHGSSASHHHHGADHSPAAHPCHDDGDSDRTDKAPAGKSDPHDMGSSCGACGVCNAVTTQDINWVLRSEIFRGPPPDTDVAAFTGGRPGLVKPPPIVSVL